MTQSLRQEAYDQLAQLATNLSLSYTVTGDSFTITLPKADKQKLDIIAKIQVPVDQEEVAGEYKMLAYNVEANLDETVKNYVEQGWTLYGPKAEMDGKFTQAIVKVSQS